jgi:hypothetical protein
VGRFSIHDDIIILEAKNGERIPNYINLYIHQCYKNQDIRRRDFLDTEILLPNLLSDINLLEDILKITV